MKLDKYAFKQVLQLNVILLVLGGATALLGYTLTYLRNNYGQGLVAIVFCIVMYLFLNVFIYTVHKKEEKLPYTKRK
jgi:uncharacterized membrane protein